jgi:hypothetical protein
VNGDRQAPCCEVDAQNQRLPGEDVCYHWPDRRHSTVGHPNDLGLVPHCDRRVDAGAQREEGSCVGHDEAAVVPAKEPERVLPVPRDQGPSSNAEDDPVDDNVDVGDDKSPGLEWS